MVYDSPFGIAGPKGMDPKIVAILHDAFYPELLDKAPDDYTKPLQLLARGIRFVDPITGRPVEYRSRLELSEAP